MVGEEVQKMKSLFCYALVCVLALATMAADTPTTEKSLGKGGQDAVLAGRGLTLGADSLAATETDTTVIYKVTRCQTVGIVVGAGGAVNGADSVYLYVDVAWDDPPTLWYTVVDAADLNFTAAFSYQYARPISWSHSGTGDSDANLAEYARARLYNWAVHDTLSAIDIRWVCKE
jgi:hypothetical protein